MFLHNVRTKMLQNLPYKAHNILHVGSAGLWYYQWFKENYRFEAIHTGVDLNPRPIGLPEDIRWYQKDVCYLDFAKDGEFDMVFAGQFIEHIDYEAQSRFLCEANRVLKPGGILVIDSPNALITRKFAWFQPEHVHELEYLQPYTLVKLAGFDIVSKSGIIPERLLQNIAVEGVVDGFVKTSDFNQTIMDEEMAVSESLNDSFVWWFCAKKTDRLPQYETILELDEQYYLNKPHFIGYCSNTGDICEENRKACLLVKEPGAALFGPYTDYPEGEYCVEFIFKGIEKIEYNPKKTICYIDAVSGANCVELAKSEIKGQDLIWSVDGWLTQRLYFSLEKTENLQFRVLATGTAPFYVQIERAITKL